MGWIVNGALLFTPGVLVLKKLFTNRLVGFYNTSIGS
jgi:hypothetical protein